jgi:type IX secretion system PorP/SprF family membrane protein
MRKFIFLINFVLLLQCFSVRGQSEAQVSQYMFSEEGYNPASIANNTDQISAFLLQRLQWFGFTNAPQTTYLTVNAPVVISGRKHDVGIVFYNDKAGIYENKSVNLQYAYRYKLSTGNLNFGGNLGFISQTIHGDSVHQITSDYHDISGDAVIPTTSVNAMSFDMSLGAYYSTKVWYAGLSVLHLFEPKFDMTDYLKSYMSRAMYLSGGYTFPLQNDRYKVKPTMLFKTDFISYQVDLDARLEKDNKYWGGLGWRLQDAIIFFIGMNFSNGLSWGYSFDLPTSKFISNSFGSHELFLRYSFSLGKKKSNKYKSVRIL